MERAAERVATERLGMPLDAFLEAANREPFELINGRRWPLMPEVAGEVIVRQNLFRALYAYEQAHGTGEGHMKLTYILTEPDDRDWLIGSRTPDVAWLNGKTVKDWKATTPNWPLRPYDPVPELVAEVVSRTDTYNALDEKVDVYLSDGVKRIWVVNPWGEKVTVFASEDATHPIMLRGDAVLDGGDVFPGFKLTLAELFSFE